MAYIGKQPKTKFSAAAKIDRFTGDGSTTAFDLANIVPSGGENSLMVYIDNVRQEPGSSKAFTIGNDGSGDLKRVTFTSAPASSASIYVITPFEATTMAGPADGTISTAKIIDANVTTAKIADANVTTAKIADANVTTAKIAADAITGAKIADDAINSEHYTDGSIDTAHIADSQVTTAKIADDAVTNAKVNDDLISGATELTSEPADTDEFLVSDAGTIKRIDYSLIKGQTMTPAFRAFHSSTQDIANTTLTTLSFDSETFDSDGTYNTSNGRFTPGVAGKYVLFANIRPNHTNVYQLEVEIRTSAENAIVKMSRGNSSGAGDSFFVYTIADLSADEYAFVTSYHSQGSSKTMLGGTTEAFFGGFKIIGA